MLTEQAKSLARYVNGHAASQFAAGIGIECVKGEEYEPFYKLVLVNYEERDSHISLEALSRDQEELKSAIIRFEKLYKRIPTL